MIKLELLSKILKFRKLASATVSLTALQYLKFFSDEISGDINECNFLVLCNELHAIWKIYINEYFPDI